MAKAIDVDHVEVFAARRPQYEAFTHNLTRLLERLIQIQEINYQIVEGRTKTIDGFREKVGRPGKSYSDPISEIPDICGCRVIVYYWDDVPRVAGILKDEFDILEEELSHQPTALEVDRFGYLSAHYVIRLQADRAKLAEWKPFAEFHAEIQIRTVIQHAWSSISHALNYKQELGIPSALQRRLNRISGLFELADEEFVGIRDQRLKLRGEAASSILTGQTDIPLTATTLTEFIESWSEKVKLTKLAREAGFKITRNMSDFYTSIYDIAKKAGIETISELEKAISPVDVEYFSKLMKESNKTSSSWTVSAPFLVLLLLVKGASAVVNEDDLTEAGGWSPAVAERVLRLARA